VDSVDSLVVVERTLGPVAVAHQGTTTRSHSLLSESRPVVEQEAQADEAEQQHLVQSPALRASLERQLFRHGWPSRSTPTPTQRVLRDPAAAPQHQAVVEVVEAVATQGLATRSDLRALQLGLVVREELEVVVVQARLGLATTVPTVRLAGPASAGEAVEAVEAEVVEAEALALPARQVEREAQAHQVDPARQAS
jgi:hypothetical protein